MLDTHIQPLNPTISVIIPSYNASRSIEQTIAALQASTLRPLEILCVDDHSTDGTGDVIMATSINSPVPITHLEISERRGAAAARNHGARYAQGSYLLFIDADVVVGPDTIEKLYARLCPPYAAIVGMYRDYSLQPGVLAHFQAFMVNFIYANLDSVDSPCLGTQCVLIPTELFRTTMGFNENYPGATVEDFELGYKLRGQGFKLGIGSDAWLTHNHMYNLHTFVRNYYNKARDLTSLLLRYKSIRVVDTGYHSSSNITVLLLLFSGTIGGAILHSRVARFWLLNLVALSIYVLWRDFIDLAIRQWGYMRALCFIFLRLGVVMLGWAGVLSALWHLALLWLKRALVAIQPRHEQGAEQLAAEREN